MTRVEAGIDCLRISQAANEQSRADQEHERQGDLCDNQQIAQRETTSSSNTLVFQCRNQVVLSCRPRRKQSEEQTRQDGQQQHIAEGANSRPQVANILPKRFDETSAFNVASMFLNSPHITETPPRLSLRFLRPHPALDVLPRP